MTGHDVDSHGVVEERLERLQSSHELLMLRHDVFVALLELMDVFRRFCQYGALQVRVSKPSSQTQAC